MSNTNTNGCVNPSKIIFEKYKKEILSVRHKMFSSLEKSPPEIISAIHRIFNSKLEVADLRDIPLMFELFPWIIAGLTENDKKSTHYISVNWLSMYMYVIFLDDHLDLKTETKADEFIGSSLLAQKGLLNLFKIVNGTKYEKLFTEALSASANFQFSDVLDRALVSDDKFYKSTSASGKNSILLLCAGAIAATNPKNSKYIISVTRELLIAIQFLDDLADFEEDFKHQNVTVLLNDAVRKLNPAGDTVDRKTILEEIICNGALCNVINTIEESITTSLIIINKNRIPNKTTNPSYLFLTNLYVDLIDFQTFLKSINRELKELTPKEKDVILDKVEVGINKIYLHT